MIKITPFCSLTQITQSIIKLDLYLENRKAKTMKKQYSGYLVIIIALLTSTCKSQQIINPENFNKIKIHNFFKVIITQSDVNSITVKADSEELSKIYSEVKDACLSVFYEKDFSPVTPIEIDISVKNLKNIDASENVTINTSNQLICDELYVKSSSSGNLNLNVKAKKVKSDLSNIGDIILIGSAQTLESNVSGSGDLRAVNLTVDTAKIIVSGNGNAKINVKNTLIASVTDEGSIIYTGKPIVREITITGTGSVREITLSLKDVSGIDTTKLKLGKKRYTIIENGKDTKKPNTFFDLSDYNWMYKNWTGIEWGINGLLNYKNSLELPADGKFLELNYPRSYQFGLNLLEKDFHIFKNYINIVTGLGFNFNHFSFQKNVSLTANSTYLTATTDSISSFTKNNLNVSYIKAPLLLEFNSSKSSSNNTHFAIGFEFECRIHSVTKQKKELNGKHYKIKQRDDFNLQPFMYSAVARFGYKNLTVFANYGMSRLFRKDQGPQVYPFTIGLAINFSK